MMIPHGFGVVGFAPINAMDPGPPPAKIHTDGVLVLVSRHGSKGSPVFKKGRIASISSSFRGYKNRTKEEREGEPFLSFPSSLCWFVLFMLLREILDGLVCRQILHPKLRDEISRSIILRSSEKGVAMRLWPLQRNSRESSVDFTLNKLLRE